MSLSEADIRAKLIDPALHRRGWTEDLIRREETDRGIDIVDGRPRRRQRGRIDYLLRIRVNANIQPISVARQRKGYLHHEREGIKNFIIIGRN
jgi:type I restriction enzyme R subunit